ncbi:MAG: class I SAM-dependent methyltransferase [Gemmatimonadales bacterium]
MPVRLRTLLKRLPGLLANPRRAFAVLRTRVLPTGVVWRDPEVYHLVGTWTYGAAPRRPAAEIFPGIEAVDVDLRRVLDRLENVSVSVRELVVLAAIVRRLGVRRVLEIGTSDGNTTLNLAANIMNGGGVSTLDLPPDWDGRLGLDVPDPMRNVTERQRIGRQYRESPLAARIQGYFGDSAKVDWGELGGPFDLVFIDGCHHYDYVVSDTERALAHLAPGGVIVWHDYGTIEDVSRAVDRFAGPLAIAAVRSSSLAVGWRAGDPPRQALPPAAR